MSSCTETFCVCGDCVPGNLNTITYVARDHLIGLLKLLGEDKSGYYDGSEPFDPERLHDTAVKLLLVYIGDPEITDAFNRVPAL